MQYLQWIDCSRKPSNVVQPVNNYISGPSAYTPTADSAADETRQYVSLQALASPAAVMVANLTYAINIHDAVLIALDIGCVGCPLETCMVGHRQQTMQPRSDTHDYLKLFHIMCRKSGASALARCIFCTALQTVNACGMPLLCNECRWI